MHMLKSFKILSVLWIVTCPCLILYLFSDLYHVYHCDIQMTTKIFFKQGKEISLLSLNFN